MIHLHLESTDPESFFVTLLENAVLPQAESYLLFVFEGRTSLQKIKHIIKFSEDLSQAPERYNQFELLASSIFSSKDIGYHNYTVYEQLVADNTEENMAGAILEKGMLQLHGEAPEVKSRDSNITFKVRS